MIFPPLSNNLSPCCVRNTLPPEARLKSPAITTKQTDRGGLCCAPGSAASMLMQLNSTQQCASAAISSHHALTHSDGKKTRDKTEPLRTACHCTVLAIFCYTSQLNKQGLLFLERLGHESQRSLFGLVKDFQNGNVILIKNDATFAITKLKIYSARKQTLPGDFALTAYMYGHACTTLL